MVEDELVTETGSDAAAGYERRDTAELVELMNVVGRDGARSGRRGVVRDRGRDRRDRRADARRRSARLRRRRLVRRDRGARRLGVRSDVRHARRALVRALVAGGETASALEQAAAEDDRDAGAAGHPRARDLRRRLRVVGVSASGRTPYVLGALEAAAERARSPPASSRPQARSSARLVDHEIAVVVGPEFLAGSTRLKAGTAQKLVLNTISTISMIRLGKTYGNLMVDVVAANEKLRERVRRIVRRRDRRVAPKRSTPLSPQPTATRASRSSRSSPASTQTTARARLDAVGPEHRRRHWSRPT